ncbi:hypothetical protein [Streptomyces millisiae]|uniref:N-acetyltransferase domain-containing protein n=1 Tax=Streptomyces millisiae TaxID=3075542 RepID=A0ABU2LV01_9ACTN|nr:hypothetical protein [Streptomyces sp. DSM 44918]MDT0321426.1 hypothetical protein [Streptomyces sp. DSM 44918]
MLETPWQDTDSAERHGWRQRAAQLDGDLIFTVDYRLCRACGLGWVEQPFTVPGYQRCGLATVGLAALRGEHPGLAWHTLGRHLSESAGFRSVVGAGVPGGYRPRRLCRHIADRPAP